MITGIQGLWECSAQSNHSIGALCTHIHVEKNLSKYPVFQGLFAEAFYVSSSEANCASPNCITTKHTADTVRLIAMLETEA